MAENKTKPTGDDARQFLASVEHEKRREDALYVLEMMEDITGEPPVMWGSSIVGFGKYHYKYESGREGDSFLAGLSPRKQSLTLYIMAGFDGYDELLDKLGKYKTGRACLYINKIEDVDTDVLRELVEASVQHMRDSHETE